MRIGIVGAGISGLSAAHYLLKMGYRDICVIDENERVGGKCYTVFYNGKSYEMGASMGLPSHENVGRLMKQFHVKPSGISITRGHYTIDGRLATQLPIAERKAFIQQLQRLPEVLESYPWLKTVGFANFPEELAQPFSKWCEAQHFEVLGKIYEQCFTTFGFGDINHVPAGYVLKVITYENLIGFLEISRIQTWAKGTGTLLQRLADQVPELRLTQQVNKIEPITTQSSDGSQKNVIKVTLNTGVQVFDKLIYTGDLTCMPQLMSLPNEIVTGLNCVKWEDFHVYAFKLKGIPELCGYVPENLTEERRGHMTVWYHQWPLEKGADMVTVYAYTTAGMSEAERVQTIIADLEHIGCSDIRLYFNKGWRHFPHIEKDAIQLGFYDAFEAIQGVNGIYYAGELLSGTNMENCVSYSEQLVQKYF